MKNIIQVIQTEKSKAVLRYNDFIVEDVFIGENGTTSEKEEGDRKTPLGQFDLGVCFGVHDKENVKMDESLEYFKIDSNKYWVDDSNSKYYNQLVDVTKVKKDWNSAEHLIDFSRQYEYAIEIKANPENIPNKRKCCFYTLFYK